MIKSKLEQLKREYITANIEIIKEEVKMLEKCTICPHKCGINRTQNIGRCKSTDKIKVALYSTHNFEEPCISGENGSGTIFFSNCNMNCIYCQNYEISQQGKGRAKNVDELSRKLTKIEYEEIENYLYDLDLENGYIQELGEHEEEYVPKWELDYMKIL